MLPVTTVFASEADDSLFYNDYEISQESDDEVIQISDSNEQIFEFTDEDYTVPTTRGATSYTYKYPTVLSEKTYTNKHLKTSSLWSTAKNSIQPNISVSVNKTNSISLSLSNGSNNFNVSQSVSLSSSETYNAKPKARGYRVSIGLYAKKVVAKKMRVSAYSRGSEKFSHYVYTNPTSFSGIYVGESHKKG